MSGDSGEYREEIPGVTAAQLAAQDAADADQYSEEMDQQYANKLAEEE